MTYALVRAVASMMNARSMAVYPVGLTALSHVMRHNRAPLVVLCKNAFHPENQLVLRWTALHPLLALACACVQVRVERVCRVGEPILSRPVWGW